MALGYWELPRELGWAETFPLGSKSKSWTIEPGPCYPSSLSVFPHAKMVCVVVLSSPAHGHAVSPLFCPTCGVETCLQGQCPHVHPCGGQGLHSLPGELLFANQHQQRQSIVHTRTVGPMSNRRTSFCKASSVP